MLSATSEILKSESSWFVIRGLVSYTVTFLFHLILKASYVVTLLWKRKQILNTSSTPYPQLFSHGYALPLPSDETLQKLELQPPLQVYLVTVIRDAVLKLMQQE